MAGPRAGCVTPLVIAAAAVAALLMPSRATAATSDEEALAMKFAPVVRLVEQEDSCGHGEPYEPTDVDVPFGSEDVVLRGPWTT